MSEFDVYLWTRLDTIQMFFILFGVFGSFIVLFISGCILNEPKVLFLLFLTAPSFLLAVATPNSKDYAMIKVLPKISNSELSAQIQKDVPELYQIAVNALKDKLAPKQPNS